ncbi:hypothetical protein ACFC3F_11515 [Microbacterium sp. NPDC055910]|uniref:hypothetical protein n=1 Tax=Microbacterium sp. NPDC055910 TaxID=3345659 RepID=UPI0035E20138
MSDLRAELRGEPAPPIPEFAVVVPSGWDEFAPTDAAQTELLDKAIERARQAHRPDLAAQLRAYTGRAFAGMRSAETLRFYIQTDSWSDDVVLPLSITASLRRPPAGSTLDAVVTDLIRTKGAVALYDDKRFVRWQSRSTLGLGAGYVQQLSTAYLTPVPGAQRTVALQFTAVVAAPADDTVDLETPFVRSMFDLTDAIVSTLVWHTT